MNGAVAIVSGGMDSTVLAYQMNEMYNELHLISFDYGQRHKKELQYAQGTAQRLKAGWSLIDLTSITTLLGTSSLTNPDIEVPDGHYAEPTMAITVVPNRNAIMLSIAYGIAVAKGATALGFAAHGGDHFIYPDCRPDFVRLLSQALKLGNQGFGNEELNIIAPFLTLTKAEIVQIGTGLQVPFEQTWSCYKGGRYHCGTCGTCVERREAFQLAGAPDPTLYMPDYEPNALGGLKLPDQNKLSPEEAKEMEQQDSELIMIANPPDVRVSRGTKPDGTEVIVKEEDNVTMRVEIPPRSKTRHDV